LLSPEGQRQERKGTSCCQQPKRSSLHYLTPDHEGFTLPRDVQIPHPAYFTIKRPTQSKGKWAQNPRVSSKALMQLFPAGWMQGTLGRSSFGQGWLEWPIARETKLENRNSKLGSRWWDFELGFSSFDFRVSIFCSNNRQSAISNRQSLATRAPPRGGALPLPPPGTEHLRQCWWHDQRGALGNGL